MAIKIYKEECKASLEVYKNCLHGKLILSKGDLPFKLDNLCAKLVKCWKKLERWDFISLGKWFYEFGFSSIEDICNVGAMTSYNLKLGLLKLIFWSPYFNLENHK